MLNSLVMFDLPCKNGILRGHGVIASQTEKAVLVKYDHVPVFASATQRSISKSAFEYKYAIWVPKSVLVQDGDGVFTIKKWFTMKLGRGAHREAHRENSNDYDGFDQKNQVS